MNREKIVIGIGNSLKKEDDFGVKVIEKLKDMALPEDVMVVDGGIGGLNLLSVLVAAKGKVLFVDSAEFGGSEGDLILTEMSKLRPNKSQNVRLSHSADLMDLYSLASVLNPNLREVKLVGAQTGKAVSTSQKYSAIERAVEIVMSELVDTELGEKVA